MVSKYRNIHKEALWSAMGLCLVGLLFAAGCTSSPASVQSPRTMNATVPTGTGAELTVYAAASLKDAFTELKGSFEVAHPGVVLRFDFDGSQVLRAQLEKGAAADVFASANAEQMNLAKAAGLVENDSVLVFASNRLAVLVPKTNTAGIERFEDLARDDLRLAVGTKDVPVGAYTRRVLDRVANTSSYGPDFRSSILGNVVSEEASMNALATKVVLGEVDAGIGYASDVPASQKDAVVLIEIPPELNAVAEYPIGVLAESERPDLARAFTDLVASPEGAAVLARHGFAPAPVPR